MVGTLDGLGGNHPDIAIQAGCQGLSGDTDEDENEPASASSKAFDKAHSERMSDMNPFVIEELSDFTDSDVGKQSTVIRPDSIEYHDSEREGERLGPRHLPHSGAPSF